MFQIVPIIIGPEQAKGLADPSGATFPYTDERFTMARHIKMRPTAFICIDEMKRQVRQVLKKHGLARPSEAESSCR